MTPEELSLIELPDTSTISVTNQPEQAKPDSLPRGSELSLITIKRLASEIENSEAPIEIKEKAKFIKHEVAMMIARIEKRRKALMTEAA
jgi:hypothetical protein